MPFVPDKATPPAPGQTISSGTWTPDWMVPAPPPSPAPQTASGPPVFGKRKGMVPGFASGTDYVSNPPAPGQTVGNGTWTPPQTNQTGANLRTQLGMGVPRPAPVPKPMGFATGGIVPNDTMAPAPPPMIRFPAPQPGMDPNAPTSVQQMMAAGAPAQSQGQPGGSLPPPFADQAAFQQADQDFSNGDIAHGLGAGLRGVVATPFSAASDVGGTVGRAVGGAVLPTAAHFFSGVMGAPTKSIPNPAPNNKQDPNPQVTAAIADQHGVTPEAAHAVTQPHTYSEDEFVAATRGMPLAVFEKLYGMHQHLTPQQLIMPRALAGMDKEYSDANALLAEAQKAGDNAKIKAAQDAVKQSGQQRELMIQRLAYGSPYYTGQ